MNEPGIAANETQFLGQESLQKIKTGTPGYTPERAKAFEKFYQRVENELLSHPIIQHNAYTNWFENGTFNSAQLKDFLVQFSVFSNLFLFAQLSKVINSDSIESMRASKEILANELGVIFRPNQKAKRRNGEAEDESYDQASDPDIVSAEGTVDGGTFRFSAAHFEWMVRIAETLDMGFDDIGKRRHGTKDTLFFCDELYRLYGSDNYEIAQAASFAIENWAAAGFWKQLIRGLKIYKAQTCPDLPIGFFTYHDRIEDQHAEHTQEELEAYYFEHDHMDEDLFIAKGREMLDALDRFWSGLDQRRQTL